MRIGQVAKETGLTLSNIRFYEKKGLLEPDRDNENQYRNYTEADVERLKTIVKYRKMNISVEKIQEILEGQCTFEDIMKEHISELEEKQEQIREAIEMCQKMTENEDTSDLDYQTMGSLLWECSDYLAMDRITMSFDPFINLPFRSYKIVKSIVGILLLCMPFLILVESVVDGEVLTWGELAVFLLIFMIIWGGFVVGLIKQIINKEH